VAAGGNGDLQLGADPVGRGDQQGVAVAELPQVEEGAEAAEAGGAAAPRRRPGERLDRLDQRVAGIDVDTGLSVGLAVYGVLPEDRLYSGHGRRRWTRFAAAAARGAPFRPGRARHRGSGKAARSGDPGAIVAAAGRAGPRGKILDPGRFAMIHPKTRFGHAARVAATLLLALLLPVAAARAQTSDVFEVRDVDVDVTADSAAAARDKAVLDGQRAAFDTLLGRIASKDDAARLAHLSDAQITDLVQDFEVESERTSAVRYIGKLAFHFRAGPVRDMLSGGQAAPADAANKPIVILPVLTSDGKSALWEGDNAWRAAWTTRPAGNDVVPIVVPPGGAEDAAAIDAGQALAGDSGKLSALAQRYQAADSIVVEARLEEAGIPGQKRIVITAHRFGPNGPQESFEDRITGDGQNLAALYAQAAQRVGDHVQGGWKQRNMAASGSELTLAVRVPLRDLSSWVEIRHRLAGVTAIKRSDVTYLSRQEARLNLVFVGDQSQLAQAVAQRDLSLTQAADGWVLAATAGGPPAGAAATPTN
jgi:hypothetical protein